MFGKINKVLLSVVLVAGFMVADSVSLPQAGSCKQIQLNSSTITIQLGSQTSPILRVFSNSDQAKDQEALSYTIQNTSWMQNTELSNLFLNEVAKEIIKMNGSFPGLQYFQQLSEQMEKEMKKYLTITNSNFDTFFKLSKNDIQNIKNFEFNGIKLNSKFLNQFSEIMPEECEKIGFSECSLDRDVSFAEILDSCSITNLSITKSNLRLEDFGEVLLRINPCALKKINISGNDFSEKDNLLMLTLQNRFQGERFRLDELNLDDSGLNDTTRNKLNTMLKNKLEY